MAILTKCRSGPTETGVTYVTGEVAGKRPLITDDIISTSAAIRCGLENLAHPAILERIFYRFNSLASRHEGYSTLGGSLRLVVDIRRVHTHQLVSAVM